MKSQPIPLALVLGVLLGLAGGCGDEPGAGAGDLRVLAGNDTRSVSGTQVPVLAPNGSFVFTVSEPISELPEGEADGSDGAAQSGTSYVGIAWRSDANPPELGPVLHGTAPLPAPVRVIQGDSEAVVTELGPTGPTAEDFNSSGVAWVAMDEDGPAPTLEVEYDGLVQTFDLTTGEREAGPADGFYEDTGTATAACRADEPTEEQWRVDVDCKVTDVAAVPYVAGHGWAEEGRTWLALGVFLTPGDFTWTDGTGEADYEIESQQGTVSAGGEVADVLSETAPLGNGWSASLVVPVDAAAAVQLEVERVYTLTRSSANGVEGSPDRRSVTYSATIDLPPAAP